MGFHKPLLRPAISGGGTLGGGVGWPAIKIRMKSGTTDETTKVWEPKVPPPA